MKVYRREILSAILTMAVGLFVIIYASDRYAIGTVTRMGPGFFPVALGFVLTGLGVAIGIAAFRKVSDEAFVYDLPWRSIIAIPAAVASFALLLKSAGFIPSAFVATVIACLANTHFRLIRAILFAAVLSVFVWLIFSLILQIQLPAFVSLR